MASPYKKWLPLLLPLGCIVLLFWITCSNQERPSTPRVDHRERVLGPARFPVHTVTFADQDRILYTGGGYGSAPIGELRRWEVRSGECTLFVLERTGPLYSLAVSADAKTLYTAGNDQALRVWDADTLIQQGMLAEPGKAGAKLTLSAAGRQLVTGGNRGTITLRELHTGKEPRLLKGHRGKLIDAMAFAPDGLTLATGGDDRTVHIWETSVGQQERILQGHQGWINCLAFSTDGGLLASGDRLGEVKIWDMKLGHEWVRPTPCSDEVTAVAFTREGLLAVASGSVGYLIEVTAGRRLASLEGHEGKVTCLEVSRDGMILASGSVDRTVRLWDLSRITSRSRR